MRFGLSRSPSPVQRTPKHRGKFSFGLSAYDSSEDEDSDSPLEFEEPVSPADPPLYDSDYDKPIQSSAANRFKRSIQEQREIDEAVESVRRKAEFDDPFSRWAKETRTAAFRAASKRYESNPASIAAAKKLEIQICTQNSKDEYERQLQQITAELENMNIRVKQQEARMLEDYQQRQNLLWQRVDGVIKIEEEKLRRRLEEEERIKREEEERKRQEEERRKVEEEQRKKEEKLRAELQAAQRKKKEQEEADSKKRQVEEAKMAEIRKSYGCPTAKHDWDETRKFLHLVKRKHVPFVKDNDTLRPLLGQVRRAIVPKIGQLTNDQSEIDRISTEIIKIVNMQPPPPEPLYFSILSALAKAILMQAETEVSARAVTAIPLAKVTIRLLGNITLFPEILYARMVQRTGGWAVPVPVPKPQGMSEVEYAKLRGFRSEREPQKDFDTRVIGIMTLYFAILTDGVSTPMPMAWAFPRYWTYFARLMSMPVLLRSDIALQIMAVALEVGGQRAIKAWGSQFVKVLELLYKSLQQTNTSQGGPNPRQIGAEGLEGKASQVKVMLEIEKLVATI